MMKLISSCIVLASMATVYAATPEQNLPYEGVSLDRTRVIISNGRNSESIGFNNKNPAPIIVSSWVTDLNNKPTNAFVISPSIYQLAGKSTGQATIRVVEELPKDRESVFWLIVNGATAGSSNENELRIAIGQRIKIFYRPDGLFGDARYAAEKLQWSFHGGELEIKNPTALSVSVSDLIFDDRSERIAEMILPYESKKIKLENLNRKAKVKKFTFVDEWGGFKEVTFDIKVE